MAALRLCYYAWQVEGPQQEHLMRKQFVVFVVGLGLLAISGLAFALSAAHIPASTPASKPASKPASQPAPTEQEFMAVMRRANCGGCHRMVCRTLPDMLKNQRWFKPGDAEHSLIYTCLNRAKNGKHYHDVSEKEKAVIHGFIQNYRIPASRPASMPSRNNGAK